MVWPCIPEIKSVSTSFEYLLLSGAVSTSEVETIYSFFLLKFGTFSLVKAGFRIMFFLWMNFRLWPSLVSEILNIFFVDPTAQHLLLFTNCSPSFPLSYWYEKFPSFATREPSLGIGSKKFQLFKIAFFLLKFSLTFPYQSNLILGFGHNPSSTLLKS